MIANVMRQRLLLLGGFLALLVGVAYALTDEQLDGLGTSILVVMLFPANYFPIFYTIAFRWWHSSLGRALFIKALGLAIVLDTVLFVKFFRDLADWAEEIRFVAYSLVLIGMIYQSVVMTRIRVEAHRKEQAAKGKATPTDLEGVDLNERHHSGDADPVG